MVADKITLYNFENLLNPDALDAGQALFEAKKLTKLKEIEPHYWDAVLEGKEVGVLLDKKGAVLEAACTCDAFEEADGVDDGCAHVAALLFALKNKIGASEGKANKKDDVKAAKSKKAATPKKPQDPAEALLAELEPKEIYEFVRQTLAKDKAFKGQFLMHFSAKNEGNEQKFAEIVATAIHAIRGRRKYLQGADGAKITTALTPLYKQAAAAEAKGLSREAFAICHAFMQEIPKVLASMETNSARLNTLFENTLEVASLVIQNNKTPFEFKNEIFETLLRHSQRVLTDSAEAMTGDFYKQLLEAGRSVKRLEELAAHLKTTIAHYQNQSSSSRYAYLKKQTIQRLFDLYWTDLKAPDKAEAVLLEHKHLLVFYMQLIRLKKEAKDYETARRYLLDIRQNPRKFQDASALLTPFDLESSVDLELLDVYVHLGHNKEVCQIAAGLFQKNYYRDFRYYTIEKNHYDPKKWPDRVDQYLSTLEKTLKSPYFSYPDAYCQILLLEQRWAQLKSFVFPQNNLKYWVVCGPHLKDQYPQEYLDAACKAIEHALKETNQFAYEAAPKVMREMATVQGGTPIVRQLLERLKQQYSNRRGLMDVLNTVTV